MNRLQDSNDLLSELTDARKSVPPDKCREFENFFIGVLSNHCPPSVWRKALKFAIEEVTKERRATGA